MADFRPETTVYLFKATGVDNENQPFFTSESEKLSWYQSHTYKVFNEYSYQRENREFIRVEGKAEQLRDYDMMCFRNSEYRYIFCRVEEVEFINPNTADIYYTIDYMQTYIDVCTFGKCWVEREMVENDWNGDKPNLRFLNSEGLETGPLFRGYVANTLADGFAGREVVVLSALDENAEPNVSSNWDTWANSSYPRAVNRIKFNNANFTQLGIMLEKYVEKGALNSIIGVFLVPTPDPTQVINVPVNWNDINGYTPVNAKCWSSEFVKWALMNKQGEEIYLQPEYVCWDNKLTIRIESNFCDGIGGSYAYCFNYDWGNTEVFNPFQFGIYMPWNCQIAYAGGGYYDWAAQNSGSVGAGIFGDILAGGIQGAFLGRPIEGAVIGGSRHAFGAIGKMIDASVSPSYMCGPGKGSGLFYALSQIGFDLNLISPSIECIRSIDEYFGRYGYRINQYKIPNVNTRPKWNFVKTAGAICRGPFGKKAQNYMQNLMDNGVTFWHLYGGENITDDWNILVNKEA